MLPQPFKIRRLGHFGLNVPDPAACLDFYCEGWASASPIRWTSPSTIRSATR